MEDEKLRLECLKIVAALNPPAGKIIELAEALFAYVTGRSRTAIA